MEPKYKLYHVAFYGHGDRRLFEINLRAAGSHHALVQAARQLPQRERIAVQCWRIEPVTKYIGGIL